MGYCNSLVAISHGVASLLLTAQRLLCKPAVVLCRCLPYDNRDKGIHVSIHPICWANSGGKLKAVSGSRTVHACQTCQPSLLLIDHSRRNPSLPLVGTVGAAWTEGPSVWGAPDGVRVG